MSLTLTLVRDHVTPTLREFARVMRRELPEVVKEAARRTTREVIAITPPASAGMVGRDAYNQGRSKINRDLNRVFAPVKLKGRRVINIVFGRPVSTPIVIKTVEQYPDLVAVYRQNSTWRTSGTGHSSKRLRHKFYVDQRKFNQLRKAKEARLGRLASGWSAAATSLGVAIPAWIRRHGNAAGGVQSQLTGDKLFIRVTNFGPGVPGNVRTDLARRLPYAMRYALNGMARNIAAVTAKSARTAKIPTVRLP